MLTHEADLDPMAVFIPTTPDGPPVVRQDRRRQDLAAEDAPRQRRAGKIRRRASGDIAVPNEEVEKVEVAMARPQAAQNSDLWTSRKFYLPVEVSPIPALCRGSR